MLVPGSRRCTAQHGQKQADAHSPAVSFRRLSAAGMTELIERLRRDPDLYPHSYEPLRDAVLLIDMTRDACAASFLDQRRLAPQTGGQWMMAAPLDAAMDEVARGECCLILHIGHVGSTLLSRLMGPFPTSCRCASRRHCEHWRSSSPISPMISAES
jgi:hypothetical protein